MATSYQPRMSNNLIELILEVLVYGPLKQAYAVTLLLESQRVKACLSSLTSHEFGISILTLILFIAVL